MIHAKNLQEREQEALHFASLFRQWFIEYPTDEDDEKYNTEIMSMPLVDLFKQHQDNWTRLNTHGVRRGLTQYAKDAYSANHKWWHDLHTGERLNRNMGELLALVHSEISEALEGHRKGLKDDKLPQYDMLDVELIDALIRIFDILGSRGVDAEEIYRAKMEYNAKRVDHQREARLAEGGKKY